MKRMKQVVREMPMWWASGRGCRCGRLRAKSTLEDESLRRWPMQQTMVCTGVVEGVAGGDGDDLVRGGGSRGGDLAGICLGRTLLVGQKSTKIAVLIPGDFIAAHVLGIERYNVRIFAWGTVMRRRVGAMKCTWIKLGFELEDGEDEYQCAGICTSSRAAMYGLWPRAPRPRPPAPPCLLSFSTC